MAIKGKAGTKINYEPVPEGNHVARVYRIIHVGTILENYMGEEKLNNKVQIGWELPNETKVFNEEMGPQPISITQEYTLSMNEKANLRKIVTGIIGTSLSDEEAEAFDVVELMGKECMLNVIHKKSKATGNTYAKVQATSPIPKGLAVPPAVNAEVLLDYEENWSDEIFEGLAKFTQDKMKDSNEYKKKFNIGQSEEDINPEDIPFS